jgi:hypothetical protein
MTTQIWGTVLSGNMGDGWRDQVEAANGFAKFLAENVRREYPNAEIDIQVNRAMGVGGGISSDNFEIEDDLNMIYDKSWEVFCGEAGGEFWEE